MMPKVAVPFGAALDPALLAAAGSSSTGGGGVRRRGPSARRAAAEAEADRASASAMGQAGPSRLGLTRSLDTNAEQAAPQRRHRVRQSVNDQPHINDVEKRAASKTTSRLHFNAHGKSPSATHLVRFPDPPPQPRLSADDVTETIYEFDSSDAVATEHSTPLCALQPQPPRPPRQPQRSSSSLSSHRLARLLAQEAAAQRSRQRSQLTHAREESVRRTLYGSKRRRLVRDSRRSIRNSSFRMPGNASSICSNNDDHLEVPVTEPGNGGVMATATAANKQDERTSSQPTQISVHSSDGIYQTQFSFYRFDESDGALIGEGGGKDDDSIVGGRTAVHIDATAVGSDGGTSSAPPPVEPSPIESQAMGTLSVIATQRGYDADQSASCSSLDQSLDAATVKGDTNASNGQVGHSTSLQHLLVEQYQDGPGVPVFEAKLRVIRRDGSPHTCFEAPDCNSQAHQRRIAALCKQALSSSKSDDVRHVRPTIWMGASEISRYFGPPSLDAFRSEHDPPERDAVRRWAEWTDSQSSDGEAHIVGAAMLTPGELLYTYDGPLARIPSFTTA